MISVKMNGFKGEVTRSHTFKKTAYLNAFDAKETYAIELKIAGIDKSSPAAKTILKSFPKAYQQVLEGVAKKRRAENDKIWQKASDSLAKGGDASKVEKDARQLLEKRWAEFADKIIRPMVEDVAAEIAAREMSAL